MTKAIPPLRDRLQSRLLVITTTPLLCWVAWNAVQYAVSAGNSGATYLSTAGAASAFFGWTAWRFRAATPAAAACGVLVCFNITVLSGRPDRGSLFHSGLSPLILLFVLTHAATRFHRRRRCTDDAENNLEGRNAAQVIANLGVAAIASLHYYQAFRGVSLAHVATQVFSTLQIPMLSAIAEATADTVSSEIGQSIGGKPFLLLNLRRVAPGTDGAISFIGTLAGIGAAVGIGITAGFSIGIGIREMARVVLAATVGLLMDSLLGATLERQGWIGNDVVNFASTLVSAGVACFLDPATFA